MKIQNGGGIKHYMTKHAKTVHLFTYALFSMYILLTK